MTDLSIIELANAIVADLRAATLPMPFDVERRWVPEYEISDLRSLRIAVAPMAIDPRIKITRSDDQLDMVIAVSLMRKMDETADADLDPYVTMAMATAKHLAGGTLSAAPTAKLVKLAHDPLVDLGWFKNHRTFFSLISTTWRTTEGVR